MVVETTRFGSIDVGENDVISFPEGMLGFSRINQYVLIEQEDESLFLWLQAVKKASVAFPLLEPQIFQANYRVELAEEDRKTLQLENLKHAKVFAIITIPSDPTKMTANLKAPIVINLKKRIGSQVILHLADYPIRTSIYSELQQHCAMSRRTIFSESDEPVYHTIPITEEFETRTAHSV